MGLSRLEQYKADEWTMRLRRGWSGWSEDGVHHFSHSGSTGVLHVEAFQKPTEINDLDLGQFAHLKQLINPMPFRTKDGFSGSVFGPDEDSIVDRSWVLRKDRYLLHLSVAGFYEHEPDRARDIDHMIRSLKLTAQERPKGKD